MSTATKKYCNQTLLWLLRHPGFGKYGGALTNLLPKKGKTVERRTADSAGKNEFVEARLDDGDVKARAIRGVASLLTRQVFIRLLGFVGMLVLARILTPEVFGVFAIAQFVIFFFEQVSGMGLSATLLRKKEEVKEIELRTVFTIQHIVVAVSLVLILLAAPEIAGHYELDESRTWLIRVLAIGLLLASLKTVPSILLQRQLRHDLLAISEVAEHIVYQVVAIALAFMGFDVWALVCAALLRGVTGVVVLYRFSWWKPAFGMNVPVAKDILGFGMPILAANMVGLLNNAVIPIVVGTFLGVSAVGFVNLARNLIDAAVYQPLILIGRVQLRVFGRIQDDTIRLGKALDRNLYTGSVLSFLLASLLISQASPFVHYVLTDKWAPILNVLYILGPGYMLYAVVQPQMQALKALGDSRTPLKATLIIFITQVLVFLLGENELGIAAFAFGVDAGLLMATIYVHYELRKHLKIGVLENIWPALVSAAVCILAGLMINSLVEGVAGMLVSTIVVILGYMIVMGVVSGERLGREVVGAADSLVPGKSAANRHLKKIASSIASLSYGLKPGR